MREALPRRHAAPRPGDAGARIERAPRVAGVGAHARRRLSRCRSRSRRSSDDASCVRRPQLQHRALGRRDRRSTSCGARAHGAARRVADDRLRRLPPTPPRRRASTRRTCGRRTCSCATREPARLRVASTSIACGATRVSRGAAVAKNVVQVHRLGRSRRTAPRERRASCSATSATRAPPSSAASRPRSSRSAAGRTPSTHAGAATPRRAAAARSGMKERARVSCTVICFNEEDNIRAALESVKWCDEIVVVDSFSTDRTLEICREYTDQIHQRPWPGFVEQKAFALAQAHYPWVLNLDADERVSPRAPRARSSRPRRTRRPTATTSRGSSTTSDAGGGGAAGIPTIGCGSSGATAVVWGGVDPHEKVILHGRSARLKSPDAALHLSRHRRPPRDDQLLHRGRGPRARAARPAGRRSPTCFCVPSGASCASTSCAAASWKASPASSSRSRRRSTSSRSTPSSGRRRAIVGSSLPHERRAPARHPARRPRARSRRRGAPGPGPPHASRGHGSPAAARRRPARPD